MKGKIFTILCWFFYAGLMYTAFHPEHAYLNVLDNIRTLYLIIHVPLMILISIFALILAFSKDAMKAAIDKGKDELSKNKENLEKFQKEYKQLTGFNLFLWVNRLIYYPAAIITFAVLEDGFLGSVMLISIAASLLLMEQLKNLAKELKNAIG